MQRGLFNTNPHQLENASSCLLCDTYLSLRGSSTKRVGIYLGIYHQVILIRVHTQASPCSAVLHRNECQKAGGGNSFYRRTGKLHAPDVPSDPLSREPGSLRWCARVWVHPRQSSPTLLYARYHLGLKHNYICSVLIKLICILRSLYVQLKPSLYLLGRLLGTKCIVFLHATIFRIKIHRFFEFRQTFQNFSCVQHVYKNIL